MKKLYKVLVCVITMVLAITAFGGCAGGKTTVDIDETNKQLYIYNYDGGVGSEWLKKVAARFEAAHAEDKFDKGKTGVQVVLNATRTSYDGLLNASDKYSVFFCQQVYYNDLASRRKIIDLTDMVKANIDGEQKSIEDKMSPEMRAALTGRDGKYYVVPHYVLYSGLTYDIDLFESKNFYFKKDGTFTNYAKSYNSNPDLTQLSAGPDNTYGTYDDGLPASMEQLEKLCTQMKTNGTIPFYFSGGHSDYSMHMLNGLWVSLTGGKDFMYNFTFDSKGEKTKIVTGFNNGEPKVEEKPITPETAYLLQAQYGKYVACDFFRKALNNGWIGGKVNNVEIISSTTSHTEAQRDYVYSKLEGHPIAMFIEGSHWYNEAKDGGIFSDSVAKFGTPAQNRNFGFMPLPTVVKDSELTGAKKNAVCDSNSSFAFISSNVKNDRETVALAKEFLKFCYSDESLQEFTTTTGVAKGVNYELTEPQYNSMNKYYQTLYDLNTNSDIVYPYSANDIFINYQSAFGFTQVTYFWNTYVDNASYNNPYAIMKGKDTTAAKYFENWLDFGSQATTWRQKYGAWF